MGSRPREAARVGVQYLNPMGDSHLNVTKVNPVFFSSY
jgi:hypothetical protein